MQPRACVAVRPPPSVSERSLEAFMVLPGSQSAITAQHTFHAAQHAVVQLTTTGYRNAAVLELADRYLGDIPEVMVQALGLRTAARRVLISARCQRHAIERRQIAQRQITAQADADLVALRLTEALANVRYQLLPQKDSLEYS